MSNPENASSVVFSRFKGIEEREALCDLEHVVESCNVEFVEGVMQKRPGRQPLFDTQLLRPTKVIHHNGTGVVTDITALASDGDIVTQAITFDPFSAGGAELFVGLPFRFGGIVYTLLSAAVTNTTLTVQYFNRGSGAGQGAFVAVSGLVDGTAVGGFTLKQSGTINWSATAANLSTWSRGAWSATAAVNTALSQDLFWVRLATAVGATGARMTEIQGTFSAASGTMRGPSFGMTEFNTRNGAKYLVSCMDFPGFFYDISAPHEARTIAYNFLTGDATPLRLPQGASKSVDKFASHVQFETFNGWLIAPTTGGTLYRWNGTECRILEAFQGRDAADGIPGAQSYLAGAPRGRYLDIYRNRLMVAGDPTSPLTFYASLEDNDLSTIPSEATVGGPNVWPLRYVFNIPGAGGDRITGAATIGDRYYVFTETSSWVFDDDSLRDLSRKIGCAASGSLKKVHSSIIFLSREGIIQIQNNVLKNISGKISETLSKVTWSAINKAVSVFAEDRQEYCLWLPINGERVNSICVIYNYETEEWRISSGWFPWDTSERKKDLGVAQNVTAATQVTDIAGHRIPVTIDETGIVWREMFGQDDNGTVFGAYAVLKKLGNENYALYRNWYANIMSDGQWIECIALNEDRSFHQEMDRRLCNLVENNIGNTLSPSFEQPDGLTGWGLYNNGSDPGTSFFQRTSRESPHGIRFVRVNWTDFMLSGDTRGIFLNTGIFINRIQYYPDRIYHLRLKARASTTNAGKFIAVAWNSPQPSAQVPVLMPGLSINWQDYDIQYKWTSPTDPRSNSTAGSLYISITGDPTTFVAPTSTVGWIDFDVISIRDEDTESEILQQQCIADNSIGGFTQPVGVSGLSWANQKQVAQFLKYKFSFGRSLTRMQPAVVWSPGEWYHGYYLNPVAAKGGISEIKINFSTRTER